MKVEFPIVTSPNSQKFDFLEKLQELAKSDFKELIVVSPFVDVYIIKNIILGNCLFKNKKVIVVTRYKSNSIKDAQRDEINEAVKEIEKQAKKDGDLPKKLTWYKNERLHAKFIIKDWKIVLFGSQNLTHRGGLMGNYELGCLIDDETEVKKLKPFMEDIIKTSGVKMIYPKSKSP